MTHKYPPVILVTGCSSGIGLAMARMLWSLPQYRVIVTARAKSLKNLSGETFKNSDRFWIRPLDITSEQERNILFQEIESQWQGVDILVNNAGISFRSVIEHMDRESELLQIDTNYLGPLALIRLALPYMRKQGRGKIINVSSVSGMLAMPTMGSYSASKFALEGASESLWYEMKPLGINVTLVQPGFVHSNSFQNIYRPPKAMSCSIDDHGPYCDYYSSMDPFIEKMMHLSMTTPEKIAKVVLRVIRRENPPLRMPATLDAWVFQILRRITPRAIFHKILYSFLPGHSQWAKDYTKARHR